METVNRMYKPFINILFIGIIGLVFGTNLYGIPNREIDKDEAHVSVVVIDAGHGGKDFGASVGNAREKDIALDLALKLGNEIKSNYPEIKVIYTRTKDVFIPIFERAVIANKKKTNLFI